MGAAFHAHAAQVHDLKLEVEKLRKEIAARELPKDTPIGKTDAATARHYGPAARASTKAGKLHVGGLVQTWYQSVQNDRVGIVKPADGNVLEFAETNETFDNDTFRIRRAELRFQLDLHENISVRLMLDPARESNAQFLPLPTFPIHNASFDNAALLQSGGGLQAGNTIIPQLLQDAYILYHGVVPHHDFTLGQFKPPAGEEAWRDNAALEFVERAMATQIGNHRDIGVMAHGAWFDDRLQYWAGVFNGPSGAVLSSPELAEGGNRSDDNDEKDISWRILGRPVWDACAWYGRLELGYARTDGIHGESGQAFDVDISINGLNRQRTDINRQAAWLHYRPGALARGAWLRGEWGSARDRLGPAHFGSPPTSLLQTGLGVSTLFPINQLNPVPVTLAGWYAAAGYRLSESRFAERLRGGGRCARALHDMEFAVRYETFENIAAEDLVQADRHTDIFRTQAYTAGVNYYLRGNNAKLQANYIWVDEPSDGNAQRGLREIRNNVFAVNFQVAF